jgi:hypothetical protein
MENLVVRVVVRDLQVVELGVLVHLIKVMTVETQVMGERVVAEVRALLEQMETVLAEMLEMV